jgi:NAD(P)-dependent dehydrogenase (short-subunit alcohol dehydrogenase family)
MGRLEGRRAIVTGAASGIGRASAELFAQEGARVLAVDVPSSKLDLDMAGVVCLAMDITRDEAPTAIVARAVAEFGGLDILFNNAGVSAATPAADMTDEAWDRVQGVNLRGTFRLSRAAIPQLCASSAGRIINTASVMAEGTDYGLGAYCASKAGVVGLTRTLALELGRKGVTANAIMPGAIVTGMTRRSFEDAKIAEVWEKKAALKRLGQPIDIARVALFLASDDAAFVTGQAIAVDGGLTLRV